MPKFIYKPEGADPLSWDFDPDKMKSSELIAIEEATGWTAAEWGDAAERGSVKAVNALLWVMLRRDRPGLDLDQVPDFDMTEIDFEADKPAPKAPRKGTRQGA
jgi:hypothetical protein